MLTLTQLGDTFGELSHLLSQAIVLPFRRRKARGVAGGGPERFDPYLALGRLVLFGGTELADKQVLQLIHLAGGREARVAILPAVRSATGAGEPYSRWLRRFGAENLKVLTISTEIEAADLEIRGVISEADLILLGSGDAAGLAAVLRASFVHEALLAAYARGAVVAAVGTGVSALGGVVARFAAEDPEQSPFVPGLALLPGVLIDSEFLSRARLSRFFHTLAAAPGGTLGLSLEEGAGLVIQPGGLGLVTGEGSVFVVEGRKFSARVAGVAPAPKEPLQTDYVVHALPAGHGYNFKGRRPVVRTQTAI